MDSRSFWSLGDFEPGDVVHHRRLGLQGVLLSKDSRKTRVQLQGQPDLAVEWPVVDVVKRPPLVSPEVRLVGLAPAEADPGAPPLCGHSGIRLAAACGLADWTLLGEVFELRNALSDPRSRATPSARRRWTQRELREGAIAALHGAAEAVVLGKDIAEALGADSSSLRWLSPVEMQTGGKRTVVVWLVPHTSGRCRWWNDPVKRRVARGILGAIARRSIHCPPGVDLASWARAQQKARALARAAAEVERATAEATRAVYEAQWAARALGAPRR